MPKPPHEPAEERSPVETFALLGNETRVGILQALWERFESGLGDNALSYSALFDRVDIDDSGNFSYHLEKLTGPFVRRTDDGYALKQTGINVVRAVVSGTVTQDPAIEPTPVDVDCPMCGAPVEIAYADELLLALCSSCEGLRRWADRPGFLFGGIVPPVLLDQRPVEEAFRAAVTYVMHQIAALHAGVCPHCSGEPDRRLEVCREHDVGPGECCSRCGRHHQAEARMVCQTCKWRVFPPATIAVIGDPRVVAFYHDHGIRHRFATWPALVRSFEIEESLAAEDPLRMTFTVPAEGDRLELVVDEHLDVVEASG